MEKGIMDVFEYCESPNWIDGWYDHYVSDSDNSLDCDYYPGDNMPNLSADEAMVYIGCPMFLPPIQPPDESDMIRFATSPESQTINYTAAQDGSELG